MKVLLTGKNGQLGYELQQTLPNNVELLSFSSDELDITSSINVEKTLSKLQPDIVINAAAYTAVDKAETDIENTYLVNHKGCEYLSNTCKLINAKLIHISTDFVFNGKKNTPYNTFDSTMPVGIYGESKLAGEKAVQLNLPEEHIIIRTAWVYSTQGNNFVKTMLRLMKEKDQLGVVYDQVGTPTWAKGLAEMVWAFVSNPDKIQGDLFHWTDAGVTSWYDFAVEIQNLGLKKGLLKKEIPIKPISAINYPTPAARPSFSVLDKSVIENKSGIEAIHWRKQLSLMLDELC